MPKEEFIDNKSSIIENLAKRKKQYKENVSQIEEILRVFERRQQIEEEKIKAIKAIKAQLKKEKDEYLLLQKQIAKSTGGAKRRKNKPLKK